MNSDRKVCFGLIAGSSGEHTYLYGGGESAQQSMHLSISGGGGMKQQQKS